MKCLLHGCWSSRRPTSKKRQVDTKCRGDARGDNMSIPHACSLASHTTFSSYTNYIVRRFAEIKSNSTISIKVSLSFVLPPVHPDLMIHLSIVQRGTTICSDCLTRLVLWCGLRRDAGKHTDFSVFSILPYVRQSCRFLLYAEFGWFSYTKHHTSSHRIK